MEDRVTPEEEYLTDWAFSAQGIAYETGWDARRVKNQVIRIQKHTSFSTNDSVGAFQNLDLDAVDEPWTDEELDTENAPPDELVLIVGHCMPCNVRDCVEELRSKWPIAPSVDEFDEGRHKQVRHRSTGLVVFWLADAGRSQTRLFTLKNRKGSLGTISPLANFQKNVDKFVFYTEFIVHPNTNAKTQAPLIKETIRQAARAAKARLELDEPQSVLNASALAPKDLNDPQIKAKDSSLSWVQTAIAAYKDTKSFSALQQIHSAVQFAKGSPDTRTGFNGNTASHLRVIRQLGQSSMTLDEAITFVDSYKILWPESVSDFSESILLPEKVVQLNNGLAAGALHDIVPTSPRVDDSLYRAFIGLFCGVASADHDPADVNQLIVSAYHMTKMVVGCSCNNVDIKVPKTADMPVLLITNFMSLLKSHMQSLDDTVSKLRGDFQGNLQGESLSIRELTRDLANTADINIAKDNVRWILQGMAARPIALFLELRNKYAREHDQLFGLLKDYGRGSN